VGQVNINIKDTSDSEATNKTKLIVKLSTYNIKLGNNNDVDKLSLYSWLCQGDEWK